MGDVTLAQLMAMQRELWSLHRDTWAPLEPEYGRDSLLWMVEELGEVIAIIKKQGDDAIMVDAGTRAHFTEEMCDVLMYYCDALLRYGVTAEELGKAYQAKHSRNLTRFFKT